MSSIDELIWGDMSLKIQIFENDEEKRRTKSVLPGKVRICLRFGEIFWLLSDLYTRVVKETVVKSSFRGSNTVSVNLTLEEDLSYREN